MQVEHLFNEALKLPLEKREDLAVRLLESVEPDQPRAIEVRQAWVDEIDRRVARLETGESTAVPIEDVWQDLTGRPWKSTSPTDE